HHRDHGLGVGDQVGELRLGQPGGLPVAFELARVVPERRRRRTWFGFGFLFRDDTQFGHGESSDGGWKGHEGRSRRAALPRVVPRAPSVWVFHRPTPVTGSTVIPAVVTADGPCPPRSTSHPGISGKDPRLTRWTENRGARWFHSPQSQDMTSVTAPAPAPVFLSPDALRSEAVAVAREERPRLLAVRASNHEEGEGAIIPCGQLVRSGHFTHAGATFPARGAVCSLSSPLRSYER